MTTIVIITLAVLVVALAAALHRVRTRVRGVALQHEQSERHFSEVFDSTIGLLRSRREQELLLRRYELLANSIRDAILFLSRDGNVVDANQAALRVFGLDADQLRGSHLGSLCADAGGVTLVAEGLRTASRAPFEVQCTRRNETFAAEITLLDCADEEPLVIAIVRDVSARRHREAMQNLLREMDRRILQNEPLDSILQFITGNVAETYGFPVVQIGLKGEDGSVELRTWAGVESAFLEHIRVRWDDSPEGRGPTGTAIRTGTLQQRDLRWDPEFAAWREKAVWHGLCRALAIPLSANGSTLGAMTVFRREAESFGVDEIDALRVLADQVAISLVAASDHEQLRLQMVALESAANAVLVTNAEGMIGWVNPAFTKLTGFSLEEARGKTPSILKSGVQNESFYAHLWESIRSGHTWHGEIYNRRKDGTVYLEEQVITPVMQHDGRISHFVAIKEDITERKKREEQIRYLAHHDALTGAANRRSLERQLERVAHRIETGMHTALVMFDIDFFKMCNDTLGHGAGDHILTELACVVRQCLRPDDFFARLGGDEFCVLVNDVTSEQAFALGERIRASVQQHRFVVDGAPIAVTVSVGLAGIDEAGDLGTVLSRADAAMYRSKREGRNRVSKYVRSDDDDATPAVSRWLTRIRTALREHDLVLLYQPIMRLGSGAVAHYEALVRMRAEDGRLLGAAEFLPVAERFGLMPQLDRWVFDTVMSVLEELDQACIFINLSAASLNDRALLEHFEHRLRASRICPGRLAFEITETAAISDVVAAQSWIQTLRECGCRFALDDFGVGFSSLSYLRTLPVDFIKIDQSFIHDLDVNPTNRALVDAVRHVAETLGKTVIAEGVETEAHRSVLRDLRIDHGQGFLWGEPHRTLTNSPLRLVEQ